MQIQAFHRKFTSAAESSNLFQALRKLSLVADFKSMLSVDDTINNDWLGWPPMEVNAVCKA
jgi:DNA-binding GntR family transcriptional regulator